MIGNVENGNMARANRLRRFVTAREHFLSPCRGSSARFVSCQECHGSQIELTYAGELAAYDVTPLTAAAAPHAASSSISS